VSDHFRIFYQNFWMTTIKKNGHEIPKGSIMDNQQREWLQCVCDNSDGVKGYGGYVTAGPGLRAVDQSLRELGYIVGVPNDILASVVTRTGRAALALAAVPGLHEAADLDGDDARS
jgi:hypothetical protein